MRQITEVSHLTALRQCPLGSWVTANVTTALNCSSSAGLAAQKRNQSTAQGQRLLAALT